MKMFFLLLALLIPALAVAHAGTFDNKTLPAATQSVIETEELKILTQAGEYHLFHVELAREREELAKGLMYRTEMPEDHGMLFIFPHEAERGFWMKNTYLSLDLIFIRKDGTIQHIHENARPLDLTSLRSKGPALAVLEINAGISAQFGLKVGDKVLHKTFSSKSTEEELAKAEENN